MNTTLKRDWRTLAAMGGVVAALHVVGFFILFVLVAPHHFRVGAAGGFTIGLGLTAYTLGLRHAFDADHISAIDNTTRKLIADGKRPLTAGFWFSLGHSSIVFALSFGFALGIRALDGAVTHGHSTFHVLSSWIGTSVSGVFLYVIAALNLSVLLGIVKLFMKMRSGQLDEQRLEEQLDSRGLINRVLGRWSGAIKESWHMYPVGLLFGLGFDTATEVALLFLAARAAGVGLPFYAILCLPILFAAGMSLLDSIDGAFMNMAYGWALSRPVRKVYYNIIVTGMSVAVALVVGTIELGGLFGHELGAHGSFWRWLEGISINRLGFIIAGLFVATWAVAVAVWHVGRIEERWAAPVGSPADRSAAG